MSKTAGVLVPAGNVTGARKCVEAAKDLLDFTVQIHDLRDSPMAISIRKDLDQNVSSVSNH